MRGVDNYGKFYMLLKRLPGEADKEGLVSEFTNGRTTSLREMTVAEYDELCDKLESLVGWDAQREAYRRALKKARSGALHQMQLWGVDTADWEHVDRFCADKRIAGKYFRYLDVDELKALDVKLRMMIRKKSSQRL